MSVNELARLLGVSRDSVYRLLKAGEIVGYRVGERLRFRPEDVDASSSAVGSRRHERRRAPPQRPRHDRHHLLRR